MFPTMGNGDLIIYRPIKCTNNTYLAKDSILVVTNPLEPYDLIIKRLNSKFFNGLDIRGDNLDNSIDSRNFGIVNFKNICGVVEKIITNPFKKS